MHSSWRSVKLWFSRTLKHARGPSEVKCFARSGLEWLCVSRFHQGPENVVAGTLPTSLRMVSPPPNTIHAWASLCKHATKGWSLRLGASHLSRRWEAMDGYRLMGKPRKKLLGNWASEQWGLTTYAGSWCLNAEWSQEVGSGETRKGLWAKTSNICLMWRTESLDLI